MRKIREYEPDFELYPNFVDLAQDIYVKSYESMLTGDKDQVHTIYYFNYLVLMALTG